MEEPAATLEAALADCGRLLVELETLRGAREGVLPALRAEGLAIGGEARRLHRARGLDDPEVAGALLRRARTLVARGRQAVLELRQAPAYRAAVAAHRAGDHAALARLLPAVLDGLEHVPAPAALLHTVPWLRRNRPRPADAVADDVVAARDHGIEAEDDPAAPGVDPELPAVALAAEIDGGSPVLLRFDGHELPGAVFRLRPSGQLLVHVLVLRAPFEVVLPETLDADELGEISLDHPRYRRLLADALAARGFAARGV